MGLGSAPLPIPPPKVALSVGSAVGWRLVPGPEVSTPPPVARLAGTSPDPYAHLRRASRDRCALEPIKESFQPRMVAKSCALEGGVHAVGRPGMQVCTASDMVPPPRLAR
ncbi:hypothetical protein H632_c5105p0 [Helicosporidium sp. ATCC 50920]|nr:hypothetical protein H632_c5105p0 [Helicosporidium sp. ATCC 50920]|eukprot:KDD71405.1 hypothetical protein H632_c5105p0 [Helicosporidium sp. ATCC 50920]